ncbi:MAG: putrescine ABC transporter permease PotI, partial [Amylibacter sp.]|nr:putrescine ABC transporter permease PotI [Amylibacter sp.]
PGANTLPILIFSRIRLGLRPDINALATIIILVVAVCIAIAALIMFRQQKRDMLDQQLAEGEK